MTQGLSDVCDPNFKPKRGDPHEQKLFTEKQNLLILYCSRPSKLIMAEPLSENTKHDKDAQQILYELHQHHSDSELSRAEVLQLTTYVANLKLTDNWRGTTTQFLLHFKEQLSLLLWMNNSLTPRGWQSCSKLWKVFQTSEESESWMV